MIKFFRKIRNRLLAENRLGKYLIYAVGEIVLVVIGILIALQLNNWNEARKTRILEVKTLQELISDLEQATEDIESNIASLETSKRANEIVLDHIVGQKPYDDSLDVHFANIYPYISFSPVQTTYNNLTQTGIKLITNDTLRESISNLYSNLFPTYKTFEKTYLVEHYTNYIKPMFMREFVTFDLFESFRPRDYNAFIQNDTYSQILNYTIENCRRFIILQSIYLEAIQELKERIEQEINS